MELETDRLVLRYWRQDDFNVYADYYADPETARFVGGQKKRDLAWRHMAAVVGHWTLKGFGQWAVEEKSTGKVIGCIGLWEPEGWPELEVGYWLVEEAQGKGYATEATLRARRYAYEALGAPTLVSYIDPENEPSKRLAERMGAWHDETIELLDLGPHCVYRHPPPESV
jgi:RimJ/RimL family protein N-acetyltransferase